jgi:transcriptional regulator with XRE-family HTH domain
MKTPNKTQKSELSSRFLAVLADSGLKQTEFGKRIGQKQNAISQVIGAGREPSKAMIQKIITEFGINAEWIYTGKGPMKNEGSRQLAEFVTREEFAEWRGYWKAGEEKVLSLIKDLDQRVQALERLRGRSE